MPTITNTEKLLSPGVNEILLEKSISHGIYLERYKNGVVREVITLLNQVDQDLRKRLLTKTEGTWTKKRLQELLKEVNSIEKEAYQLLNDKIRSEIHTFGIFETAYQSKMIQEAVPVRLNIVQPAPEQLYAAVMAKPFQGALLSEELVNVSANRKKKIINAIRQGYTEGQTTQEIVRRLFGSRAMQYKDGLLERSRNEVEALTRTAIAHTSAVARTELYRKNNDLIKGEMIVATLDGKTTIICMNYDGQVFQVGEGPRPPFHWRCRSTTIPIVKSWRELGIDLDEAPMGTRASMDGQVPASMKYEEFLRKQSPGFQDDVLGKQKAQWFREGVSINKFVNDGRVLTIKEIAEREGLKIIKAVRKAADTSGPIESEDFIIPKFESNKEAADWIVKQGLADKADFGKIDAQIAQDWAEGIYTAAQKYPELRKMEFVGSSQARNRLIKEKYRPIEEAYYSKIYTPGSKEFKQKVKNALEGHTGRTSPRNIASSSWEPGYTGIALNENRAKNYITFKNNVKFQIDIGYWSKGSPDVFLVVNHELGHELDRLLSINTLHEIQELYYSTPNINLLLSRRATVNVFEMIAEGWAEYNTSPQPRALAEKIGKIIEREYSKWKKK